MDNLTEMYEKNKDLDERIAWSDYLTLYVYNFLIRWTTSSSLFLKDFNKNIDPGISWVKLITDLGKVGCGDDPCSEFERKIGYLGYSPGYKMATNTMSDGTREMVVTDRQECSEINFIDELIALGNNGAVPIANLLAVRDSFRGVYLEISRLLPPGDIFVPARFLYSFDESCCEKEFGDLYRRVSKSVSDIMEDYKGQSKEEGENHSTGFIAKQITSCEFGGKRLIGYENLGKPGGILSILHEIAHGWQMILNDTSEYLFVERATYFIQLVLAAIKDKKCDNPTLDYIVNKKISCLEDMYGVVYGGMVHYKQIDELPLELIESFNDHIFLHRNGFVVLFLSNTDDYFNKVINIKRWMERNAWYCSLRIIRSLRKSGFDIEPSMSDAELLKYARQCLSTYDGNVKDLLKYDCRIISYL